MRHKIVVQSEKVWLRGFRLNVNVFRRHEARELCQRTMPRTQKIFHNLVTDENSTTELLCYLMRFPAFRQPAIRTLLGVEADVAFEQIDTQADLTGQGCAPLQRVHDMHEKAQAEPKPISTTMESSSAMAAVSAADSGEDNHL